LRPARAYTWLAAFSFAAAIGALVLLGVALVLSESFAALAAGLCAAAFLIPGLFIFQRARTLYLRDAALAHAGALAEAAGVMTPEALGEALHVPARDAERILRVAIREGHARGTVDAAGRFVAAAARHCPRCHEPLSRETIGSCPRCGAPLHEGEVAG